jgi:putative membrane-bound dehydrogenase-like protein
MTGRRVACCVIVGAAAAAWSSVAARAAAPEVQSPVTPRESLEHLVVEPGLRVELVAHEPQILSPVEARFDELGRLWVVEMRDYPVGPKPGEAPMSRISVLEDRDADGLFETSVVFAENLLFATGVQPWKGGVFVTMAGEVAYMKDADGDGRADVRETWYKGFAQGNSQLRANHPRLGLDNHIYVANGSRGGSIVDAAHPERQPVSISGMDFRFDPLTREFEAVSGFGQFGLTFDDFGNRFVCSNRNPAIHVVLENQFLKKNPLAAVPATSHNVARPGAESRVFPIARSWTTSNLHAGQFTAACGVEVYRGDALGPDYYGNLFVCEPTGHLVHREIVRASGATFDSTTPHEGVEFLASHDSWFSPVNLETGPDGALYVVDMYRKVIEHPDWMPPELQHRPDQMAGSDCGRIYRVTSNTGHAAPSGGNLAIMSNAQLVDALKAPNAWRRETAARLLLERQDKSIGPLLRETVLQGDSRITRIHALWLLEGLNANSGAELGALLRDRDRRVIEQAVAASGRHVGENDELRGMIASLTGHDDARVRLMALLVSGVFPQQLRWPADEWERTALLIAAGARGGEALAQTLTQLGPSTSNADQTQQLVIGLARLAAASTDGRQYEIAVESLLDHAQFRQPGLTTFFAEASRRGKRPATVLAVLPARTRGGLVQLLDESIATANDLNEPDERRCKAVDLAALSGRADGAVANIAAGDPSQAVRLRAIAALTADSNLSAWRTLLAGFSKESPAIRSAILDGVLARPERTSLLLDEFAAGHIQPAALGAAHLDRLLKHTDPQIKQRASQLAAAAVPADRQQVLADYQSVLTMHGDAQRGRQVFEKHCATCHRIADVGVNVAPDISDSRERTIAQYLTDILQPNRAIDANYFSYSAATVGGLVHTGILAAETSTSVTLKQAEGKSITLPRDEIEELRPSGMSLMPEGLEREIPKQDMADLISFIKNWRYLDGQTPLGDR